MHLDSAGVPSYHQGTGGRAMTEAEWLACNDPSSLLKSLKRKKHDRKRRLFAVACCRRVGDVLTDPAGRAAVEVAERYADGGATGKELAAACRAAARATADYDPMDGVTEYRVEQAVAAAMNAAARAGQTAYAAECSAYAAADVAGEQAAQCDLLRCVFHNPFRPILLNPTWQTTTVVGLAEGIYADRAFDRLPILADALQDAGCEVEEILAHCRGDGPHVRGCWVVDLVLGRG